LKWKPIACNIFSNNLCRFKLAQFSVPEKKIYASAACIGLINRRLKVIATDAVVLEDEDKGGNCILDTLASFTFPEGEPANTKRLIALLKEQKPIA
jgi:hypothetical protein